jgi:CRP-like cAMP-binding protein
VTATNNRIISSLTKADQGSLLKNARKITLTAGEVLPQHAQKSACIYFPIRGSIALYLGTSSPDVAHGLAVGLMGPEGVVGLEFALGFGHTPFQFTVQSNGEAYVVEARDVQKLIQIRPKLLFKFSQYLWSVYEGIANFAAKTYTKDMKVRLAHWLLLSASRCAPDPLKLTHLNIAKMLGVRRSSISIAAREMKLKGLIHYTRGQILMTNISALEKLANS